MRNILSPAISGALLALVCLSATVRAQTATATLKGVVTDNNGAAAPGAVVTLTQASTGAKRTFSVDSSGQFTFTFVEPGGYRLEAQSQGFKRFVQDGIRLEVGQLAELNVSLQPGEISESVNIAADQTALQLDTGSGALGGVIERSQVDALPLNGRNVLQLAQLEPGVNSSPGSRRANPGLGAVGEISINGGRSLTNEIVIDGISVTQKADNLAALKPSPDAVQEFRIVTNSFSAEYGRTGGGALNFSIRSGGAKFRGTLWEYLRNDAFDARTAGDEAVGRLAFGTVLRMQHRKSAVMADELPPEPMIDQPGVAIRALHAEAAGAAQRQRRIAAPVHVKERLLAAQQRFSRAAHKRWR